MTLLRLVEAFGKSAELPIEIPDIKKVVQGFGIQDTIVCIPENSDPGKCRGIYYQFTRRPKLYGEPELVSLIVYSANLDVEWQRVICAKEMIHIMDAQAEKTRTEEEVTGLLDKLLGPLSTEDYGLADLMAAVDKLALYQCLTFLFPDAARAAANDMLVAKERSIEQIAIWAALPLPLARLVMSSDWPDLKKLLLQTM